MNSTPSTSEVAPLLAVTGVSKAYGHTQALTDVSLDIRRGEIAGLVGHNGAGKSTLMRVICGQTVPDVGTVSINGQKFSNGVTLPRVRRLGIQIVFQELSLSPTMRVFENALLVRPQLAGWGWRKNAQKAICSALDEIFPGHGISPTAFVSSLSLAKRQMVEIAQTAIPDEEPVSVLILDEPTSALGREQASNLFAYTRRLSDRGVATILISHKMKEILENTTKTVVMKDGRVVEERPTDELDSDTIIAAMSSDSTSAPDIARTRLRSSAPAEDIFVARGLSGTGLRGVDLSVAAGEIVGISGLDGQGQQELLQAVHRAHHHGRRTHGVGRVSFISGDRQNSGVFPLWSTGQNIGISVIGESSVIGVVNRAHERSIVADWMARLSIRGDEDAPILALSGGNQQKALVARALAVGARLVLLDDPFRGVDVGTKRLMYAEIHAQADKGRSFLWFTTENAELTECDRVLVMSNGQIVKELQAGMITEAGVISASFTTGS